MRKIYNFSAGPSMLPEKVLVTAASEMTDYKGTGESVMEMSHRSAEYDAIIKECEALLREVMGIPDNYKVLFIQGGASAQFSMVPLNLMKNKKADYIISGQFSNKAYKEGCLFGECTAVASSKESNFTYVPVVTKDMLSKDADYLHICFNNTIYGTKYPYIPETGDIPLVADMSSCILSEPVDVSKFGLIYAGVQKNMGPAGMAVSIIREDLVEAKNDFVIPTMYKYSTYAENGSMYNTPPTYCIYIVKLVLEWIKNDVGGLANMKKINEKKAALLYDYLDNSKLFKAPAEKGSRSMMNVTFVTGNEDLDKKFCKEAAAAGFLNIKGHRSVGGMRASIYNAMPTEGVEKLVAFMKEFEKNNG